MRIGIVLPNQPVYSETFFNTKIKGLESHGHEVILFVNNSTSDSNYKKIKAAPSFSKNKLVDFCISCKCFLMVSLFHFSAAKRLFILNRKDKFSIADAIKNIITNSHILSEKIDWLHFGFGTMAIGRENVARAIGAKMSVSFRGFDHYVYPLKNKECYNSLFEKDVKYHTLSDAMKMDLLKFGICKNKITKITPAIDLNLFHFESNKQNDEKIDFEIVTVSRLHWIKGLNYILEALKIVKHQGINFHFTIIGDGTERERLQFEAYQLGLTDLVTFAGKLTPIEIKNKLKDADLYLQYSNQEGFCNAVLEAQAMGKICIVSDADGLLENVVNIVTGFVVPKRKPLYLADKILEVLAMSTIEKHQIAEQAIARVRSNFNIENQIHEFIKFYEEA